MWFGLIMVPGTLALISMRVLDRYMLTYLSAEGLHDVGIYSTGYRVGMIMQFLVTVFSLVFISYAMRIADRPEAKGLSHMKPCTKVRFLPLGLDQG